jgi:hypothetical protein
MEYGFKIDECMAANLTQSAQRRRESLQRPFGVFRRILSGIGALTFTKRHVFLYFVPKAEQVVVHLKRQSDAFFRRLCKPNFQLFLFDMVGGIVHIVSSPKVFKFNFFIQ